MSVFDKLESFEQRCQDVLTCSGCRKHFASTQKFCSECGIKLEAAAKPSFDPPNSVKCSKCFHFNPAGTKFCSECGTNMQASMTTGREAVDLPRAPRAKYVPPDHTTSIPVVKESAEGCYDIGHMNIRGQ